MAIEKIKILQFWSCQLNSTADLANLAQFWDKWAGLARLPGFSFSPIILGAKYWSYLKSIATFVLRFFGYIISVSASVEYIYQNWGGTIPKCFHLYVPMGLQWRFALHLEFLANPPPPPTRAATTSLMMAESYFKSANRHGKIFFYPRYQIQQYCTVLRHQNFNPFFLDFDRFSWGWRFFWKQIFKMVKKAPKLPILKHFSRKFQRMG